MADPQAARGAVVPLDEDLELVGVVHGAALGDARAPPLDAVADLRDLVAVVRPRSPHTDRNKREAGGPRPGLNARAPQPFDLRTPYTHLTQIASDRV